MQGQLVGWNNQIDGEMLGRAWGAAGARVEAMAWKAYTNIESELLNVHDLNHKINFEADYRDAFSNVHLNEIGVQDTLDDNTYEFVRRYFALTNYAGGLFRLSTTPGSCSCAGDHPDHGHDRRSGTMQTLQLGIRQRLQTKRGPEGTAKDHRLHALWIHTTYFPARHERQFRQDVSGRICTIWQWYVGDRTSIYSYGWVEFLNHRPAALEDQRQPSQRSVRNQMICERHLDRPASPRQHHFGYSIINTGTIDTSALNVIYSYWFSPKWYASFGTSYDFGNAVLLGRCLPHSHRRRLS